MFGKIVYISDSVAHISIPDGTPVAMDLMNMHVVFEDEDKEKNEEVSLEKNKKEEKDNKEEKKTEEKSGIDTEKEPDGSEI